MQFRAYFKKEFIESLREHRVIILFLGFLFFALATPPLLKLTPEMLEAQYGSDMASILQFSALDAVKNFIGSSLSQICILVLVLTLGGIFSNEVKTESIVIPLTKGIGKGNIALAKIIFYSILVSLVSVVSVASNIVYSYVVFNEEIPESSLIFFASIRTTIYVLLIMALVFFFSSIFNKSIIASLAAMVINIILSLITTFNYDWNPYNLLSDSSSLSDEFFNLSLGISCIAIIGLFLLVVYIFKRKDIYN